MFRICILFILLFLSACTSNPASQSLTRSTETSNLAGTDWPHLNMLVVATNSDRKAVQLLWETERLAHKSIQKDSAITFNANKINDRNWPGTRLYENGLPRPASWATINRDQLDLNPNHTSKPYALGLLLLKSLQNTRGDQCEEIGYFSVPGGFALVTALERVKGDATPWDNKNEKCYFPSHSDCTLGLPFYSLQVIKNCSPKLFSPQQKGLYRQFVFILTDQKPIFTQQSAKRSQIENKAYGTLGSKVLPYGLVNLSLNENHKLYSVLYAFRSYGTFVDDDNLGDKNHPDVCTQLIKSGILGRLIRNYERNDCKTQKDPPT